MKELLAIGVSLLVVLSVFAATARADGDGPLEPTGTGAVETPPDIVTATPDEARRDSDHYRGRTREPTTDEVVLWVPRIVFFPLHLVSEYLIRLPLLAILTWAEQNHLFAIFDRIFNPTPDISWAPSVTLEAGVFAVPGLTAGWRNMGIAGHELRIAGTFAGDAFWSAQLRDQWTFAPVHFGVRGGYLTRPDRAFYGLGPHTANVRSNYRETRAEAFAFVGIAHENYVRLEVTGGWSREIIGPGIPPTAQTGSDAGAAPGLGPFDLVLVGADFRLDSRRVREENGGLRMRAGATYGLDVLDSTHDFLTVDVEVEAAVEIARPDRVLATRVYVAETASLGGGAVPFLHLAALGWNNHQGFVQGRFRGEAAFLAEVRYRYPIAFFVDVQWIASVGNVFGRDFSDFTAGALTGSFGVGLRTRRTGSDPIEVTVAVGTSRFDSELHIDSVRLFLSTTQGL